MTIQEQSLSPREVIAYAGSFEAVLRETIGPGFTAATGWPFVSIGGPSNVESRQTLLLSSPRCNASGIREEW